MPQCVYANFVVGFNGFKSLLKEENVKMVWSTALKRPSVLVSYRTDRRTRQLELRLRSSIIAQFPHCLKITENVAFNIASEASYFYILSRQKFIKNAKNGAFWRFFENATFWVIFKHCVQRVAKHREFDIKVKLSKIPKFLLFQKKI